MALMENDWFNNPKWWFAGSTEIDQIICEKFNHLLDDPYFGQQSFIEKILRYDQLPRHMYRTKQLKLLGEHWNGIQAR